MSKLKNEDVTLVLETRQISEAPGNAISRANERIYKLEQFMDTEPLVADGIIGDDDEICVATWISRCASDRPVRVTQVQVVEDGEAIILDLPSHIRHEPGRPSKEHKFKVAHIVDPCSNCGYCGGNQRKVLN